MATFELTLPDIGEGVVEGEIVKWLVQPGDAVVEDQPVVEMMTDKATVTIPSPRRGKVKQTHGKEGDMAKIHGLLVTLEVEGEGEAQAVAHAAPVASTTAAAAATDPQVTKAAPMALAAASAKVLATPVTRRMAREHGIDLAAVAGSGAQGRVTKADVQAAMTQPLSAPKAGAAGGAAVAPLRIAPSAGDQRIPLKGLRKKIAEKMVRSKFTAPHFTFVEEVDVTELVKLRQRLNAQLAETGDARKLSFLPFVCKALVAALRRYPHLNANFDEEKQELVVRGDFHFGIAAATEDGLTVPVVKHVDRLSLRELADEIGRLGTAAKERRLQRDELGGGTFTVTSLGQTGGLMATPIINHPEVGIVGLHKIKKRPAVVDDEIVIREMMNVSLSCDHRVIDGSVGAEFTYALIRYLERPELLFLELA